MSKRVQIIPLMVLIVCGGISMSSGLYYYEINEIVYPLHLILMALLYYLVKFLFREYKRQDLISLCTSLGSTLVVFVLLRDMIIPGFGDMLSTVSWKIKLSYGIDFGIWQECDKDYVGLAICQLVMVVTVLSLYLYETKRPVVIIALPSFLLFIVSVIADGVPYEACMYTYGAALIVFLGMGRRGESVKKLAVLTVCVIAVGLFSVRFFEWNEVSSLEEEYRDMFVIQGGGLDVQNGQDDKKDKPKDDEEKENKQIINFGQFSWEGSITYNETVELRVSTDKEFEENALFLRGFIGESYRDNIWFGDSCVSASDTRGLFCKSNSNIHVENVFDGSTYVAYSVNQQAFESIMQMSNEVLHRDYVSEGGNESPAIVDITTDGVGESNLSVDESLKKRIDKEILGDTKFDTIGDVVGFVMQYYSKNYEYTLYPGAVFYDKDEIEYFLFERKSGYCTHFASSAIMIFRSIGIPARLAQGYTLSGDLISPDKVTEVYDSNAHAWVEIYVEGFGWFPVDVTPQMNGVTGEGYGEYGYNAAAPVEGMTLGNTTSPPAEATEKPKEDKEKQADKKDAKKEHEKKSHQTKEGDTGEESLPQKDTTQNVKYIFLAIILILFTIAIVSVCVFRHRARKKRGNVKETYSTKLLQLNGYLQALWRALGVRWNYMDSKELTENIFKATAKYYQFEEEDHIGFDDATRQESTQFRQEINSYVVCVYKSRYGGESISDEEYKKCFEYLLQLIDNLQRHADRRLKRKVKKYNKLSKRYKEGNRNHE